MTLRMTVVACVLVLLGAASGCGGTDSSGEAGPDGPSGVASTAPPPPKCASDARCYDFSTSSDGWPNVNDDNHFAGRDPYLDGTYRLGARQSGSWSLPAPVKVSDLSSDYAVQIDTDATMAKSFPDEAAWGASCWTRPVGAGQIAGFGVYVQPKQITVGLFDQSTGAFRPLKSDDSQGLVKPGEKSHLTMTCRQDTASGAPVATVKVQINGKPTIAVSYARSVKDYAWQTADGVGLLAAGQGADVFYDNVVVSAG